MALERAVSWIYCKASPEPQTVDQFRPLSMTILKYLFKICLREKGNDVFKREEKALAGGSVMSPLFTALNSSERPKLA